MKQGRKQAKDVDDRFVLETVHRLSMEGREYGCGPPYWVMAWDLEKALGLEGTGRLLLAKCESLIKRKLLDGCPCGCRGDFELTAAGKAFLQAASSSGSGDR